ncbi:urea transporter [Paraburkholderia diazotrophica]|uniref:Urea transporter n=1 Tax=Paraburkholderia diazotrophica TaxID=667676 RepID=A0A1H7E283_9BURK|nr:urea transporter [Paraburkholderia diazotrophica]SEK08073.1 urea transporter [Paraburkholderia diazotrophica]
MHAEHHQEPFTALRTLLRSFGQIVLQRDARTGACVLAAWLVCDPRLACAASTGAIAANVGAVLRGYDPGETRDGLHGFNGALAALAAFTFVADDATAMAIAILAATAAAWFLGPWARLLRSRGLGYYSSPCLLVTWTWLPIVHGAFAASSVGAGVGLSVGGNASDAVAWMPFARALLAGIAQTSFASTAWAGLLILAGIAMSSMRCAAFALAGAALATAAHSLIGVDTLSLDAGLWGFNGALTALALADCGALAALVGVCVSISLQQAAAFSGVPVLTAPFVVATWTVSHFMRDTRDTHISLNTSSFDSAAKRSADIGDSEEPRRFARTLKRRASATLLYENGRHHVICTHARRPHRAVNADVGSRAAHPR